MILYHGTDETGYKKIAECGQINPVYSDSYNCPYTISNNITYAKNGMVLNGTEKDGKVLNPFFFTPFEFLALNYGNVILKINRNKIKNICKGDKRIIKNRVVSHEYFTYDILNLNQFEVIKYPLNELCEIKKQVCDRYKKYSEYLKLKQ